MPQETKQRWTLVKSNDALEVREQGTEELVAVVVDAGDAAKTERNAAYVAHAPEMHDSLQTVEIYLTHIIASETAAHAHARTALRFVRAILQRVRASITS